MTTFYAEGSPTTELSDEQLREAIAQLNTDRILHSSAN